MIKQPRAIRRGMRSVTRYSEMSECRRVVAIVRGGSSLCTEMFVYVLCLDADRGFDIKTGYLSVNSQVVLHTGQVDIAADRKSIYRAMMDVSGRHLIR